MSATGGDLVRDVAARAGSRLELWTAFVNEIAARRVAEVGVFRGAFAGALLDACPSIDTYYMIDPWRHLEDWNKPANRDDEAFERIFAQAMERTRAHEPRRVVLRGRTTAVIDRIPDETLDLAYIDGDHTLRGIAIDLIRVHAKVRPGGWIAGDDLSPSIWQHGDGYEPTLVFPFAVHFAEAVGARIYALPHAQFLIERREGAGFEFVDLVGRYGSVELRRHLVRRAPPPRRASLPRRVLRRLRGR